MTRRTAFFIAGCLMASALEAQTSVTLCASDTQSGQGVNLAQAIPRGGTIVFDCPPQTRIAMTAMHVVPNGTVIDGGDAITLDAEGRATTMFVVAASGSASFRRITMKNARMRRPAVGRLPPSVIHASGNLTLDGVTVEGSEGAVTIRGAALIVRSRFIRNRGTAMNIEGSAEIEGSSFIGNETGLSIDAGTVHNCTFVQNTAGALRVFYPKAEVRIIGCSFERNDGAGAVLLSQRARAPEGAVTIRRGKFTMNGHPFGGGAINVFDTTADAQPETAARLRQLPPARYLVAYSRFTDNRGRSGGAINADLSNTRGMVIQGGIFTGNEGAESGGAITWEGRALLVTNSLFRSNRAGSRGSALHGRNHAPGAAWTIANSLIAENVAGGDGSAVDAGPVSLINVTVARNAGVGVTGLADAQPRISNTILSENSAGNCRGVSATAFREGNLQFGAEDCPGVPVTDPELDGIYVPSAGSPALAFGDLAICRADPVSAVDVVFQSRGLTGVCTAGAFERPPTRLVRSREQRRIIVGESPGHTPAPEPTEASRFVLGSLAAEEQAPQRRMEVTLQRGGQQLHYTIEKAGTDRLHIISSGSVADQELFLVDGRVYQKIDGAWKTSTAFTPAVVPPFLDIVTNGLSGVTEGERATENDVEYRTFKALAAWHSASGTARGILDFTIAAETQLPRRITFAGECNGVPCAFDQTFDYAASIVIEPPER